MPSYGPGKSCHCAGLLDLRPFAQQQPPALQNPYPNPNVDIRLCMRFGCGSILKANAKDTAAPFCQMCIESGQVTSDTSEGRLSSNPYSRLISTEKVKVPPIPFISHGPAPPGDQALVSPHALRYYKLLTIYKGHKEEQYHCTIIIPDEDLTIHLTTSPCTSSSDVSCPNSASHPSLHRANPVSSPAASSPSACVSTIPTSNPPGDKDLFNPRLQRYHAHARYIEEMP